MGEEADVDSDYDGMANDADNRGVEERVLEWEAGLPTASDDLTPLSQPLFPPELASAFSISPEPPRTLLDVYRASQDTLSSLRRQVPSFNSSTAKDAAASVNSFPSFSFNPPDDPVEEKDEVTETESSKKVRVSSDEMEELDSSACGGDVGHNPESIVDDGAGNRAAASKKPRLVWTPQLHKRFVDVVAHLGINSAVPKTMMQLMNVEGLTRENVASHLQKYRLYVKRMQGISDEGPSSPPENSHAAPQRETPVTSTPYVAPPPLPGMIQMPVVGVAHGGHLGMIPVTGQTSANSCGGGSGRAAYHPYPMFGERPREWPRSGSSGSYPRPTNSDKMRK